MANMDAPYGFHYNGNLCEGGVSAQVWKCNIPAADTDNWYIGDPVVISGALTSADGMFPGINLATAGDTNPITGIVVSFEPPAGYENYKKRLGAVCWKAFVCFDPYAVYDCQVDEDGAAWTYTDVWLNCCAIDAGGGSVYTGLSGWELDGSDAPAADGSNQLQIVGLLPVEDNTITSANSRWLVRLSHSQLVETTTAGDGVLGVA